MFVCGGAVSWAALLDAALAPSLSELPGCTPTCAMILMCLSSRPITDSIFECEMRSALHSVVQRAVATALSQYRNVAVSASIHLSIALFLSTADGNQSANSSKFRSLADPADMAGERLSQSETKRQREGKALQRRM